MTSLSQYSRDRILWMLPTTVARWSEAKLRAATMMRYAYLNPILEELVKEGRIKIALGKNGDMITLISR